MFASESLKTIAIGNAGELVARSMINTPPFVEIFRGDEASRLPMSMFLFKKKIAMMQIKAPDTMNCFYSDNGQLECFFILVPKQLTNFSFCEQLAAGLYLFPFVCGFDVTQRLMATGDMFDKKEAEVFAPYSNYLKLNHMVVSTEKQGMFTMLLSFGCI